MNLFVASQDAMEQHIVHDNPPPEPPPPVLRPTQIVSAPEFDGLRNSDGLAWLYALDAKMQALAISESDRMRQLPIFFPVRSQAGRWFLEWRQNHARDQPTWADFKDSFLERFSGQAKSWLGCLTEIRQQPAEPARAFYNRFFEEYVRLPSENQPAERQIIALFVQALRPPYRSCYVSTEVATLQEALDIAERYERLCGAPQEQQVTVATVKVDEQSAMMAALRTELNEFRKERKNWKEKSMKKEKKKAVKDDDDDDEDDDEEEDNEADRKSSSARSNSSRRGRGRAYGRSRNSNRNQNGDLKCWRCGKPGHKASECHAPNEDCKYVRRKLRDKKKKKKDTESDSDEEDMKDKKKKKKEKKEKRKKDKQKRKDEGSESNSNHSSSTESEGGET